MGPLRRATVRQSSVPSRPSVSPPFNSSFLIRTQPQNLVAPFLSFPGLLGPPSESYRSAITLSGVFFETIYIKSDVPKGEEFGPSLPRLSARARAPFCLCCHLSNSHARSRNRPPGGRPPSLRRSRAPAAPGPRSNRISSLNCRARFGCSTSRATRGRSAASAVRRRASGCSSSAKSAPIGSTRYALA
jgi:hypothetical protein